MTQISVNLNKVALLRNSRGRNYPNLLKVAKETLEWGAHGITLHPRPDERHAKKTDVPDIVQLVKSYQGLKESNIEGYPSEDWLALVEEHGPDQATLVPDPPDALTSNAGWDFLKSKEFIKPICRRLMDKNIRVSLFLEVDRMTEPQWEALAEIRPDRIELYTEAYAEAYAAGDTDQTVKKYLLAAQRCKDLGIDVNAGHDLDLNNLPLLLSVIPEIKEVSIGHALIVEALYLGLEQTVKKYLDILGSKKNA